jgi:hypothetical protein
MCTNAHCLVCGAQGVVSDIQKEILTNGPVQTAFSGTLQLVIRVCLEAEPVDVLPSIGSITIDSRACVRIAQCTPIFSLTSRASTSTQQVASSMCVCARVRDLSARTHARTRALVCRLVPGRPRGEDHRLGH